MRSRRTRCHGCGQSRARAEMIPAGKHNVSRCAFCVEDARVKPLVRLAVLVDRARGEPLGRRLLRQAPPFLADENRLIVKTS
jgi:hypothetical protein